MDDVSIFEKQISLAEYCLDMELDEDAFIKIDRAGDMSFNQTEREEIEAYLGHGVLEKLSAKASSRNKRLMEPLKKIHEAFDPKK